MSTSRKGRSNEEQSMTETNGFSRRVAMQRGLGAAAGVVMVWAASGNARAADGKLPKATVQYTDSGAPKGMDCDDCIQFIPGKTARDPATCKVVEGDISPHGHCLAFSPKPKS
jgi:hypothetical protein